MPWFKSNWLKSSGFQLGNLIFIAWLFQDLETFKKLADHTARDSTFNKLGNFEVKHLPGMNFKMVEEHVPSGLFS